MAKRGRKKRPKPEPPESRKCVFVKGWLCGAAVNSEERAGWQNNCNDMACLHIMLETHKYYPGAIKWKEKGFKRARALYIAYITGQKVEK